MTLKKRGDETPENVPENMENTPEMGENKAEKKKKSQNAVLVYVVLLFAMVLLLMVLSYFIQQRHNNATISSLTAQHSEFSIQALENIEELQETNQKLEEDLKASQEKAAALEEELAKTEAAWTADAKRLNGEKDAALTEEREKAEAMGYLLDLYVAVKEGGGGAKETLDKLEPLAGKLDGAYAEMYETLKTRVK